MYWTDLALLGYPLVNTFRVLKYPRLRKIKHWLIFWYIYLLVEIFELVTFGFFPFWGLLKPAILIANWKPGVSEFAYKMVSLGIRHGQTKLKNFEQIKLIKGYTQKLDPYLEQFKENPYIRSIIWFLSENDQSIEKKQF